MGRTTLQTQPSLSGGLNQTTDILKVPPDQWLACSNIIVGRSGGSSNNLPGKFLSAMTTPPMRRPTPITTDHYSYGATIPKRYFVARGDSTEPWVLPVNGSFSVSGNTPQGNNFLSIICNDSHTNGTTTLILSNSINISNIYNTLTLYLDGGNNHIGNISIALLDSSGNGAHYAVPGDSINTGKVAIPYVSLDGGTNLNQIVSISITTSRSILHQTMGTSISDIRFENPNSLSFITNSNNLIPGLGAVSSDGSSIYNSTNIAAVVACQDMVLVGIYPYQTWYKLVVGLPHTPIINSPTGTNIYFSQVPYLINPANNLLFFMDGASTPRLFWPQVAPGNQFTTPFNPIPEVQTLNFSSAPTSGTWTLTWNGVTSASINWNDTAAQIQTKLQAMSNIGAGNIIVTGSIASTILTLQFAGTLGYGVQPLVTISSSLSNSTGVTFTSGSNGQQTQIINPNQTPTGGTYTLTIDPNGGAAGSYTTGSLAYNATNTQIQVALQAIFKSGFGNAAINSVTGDATTGMTIVEGNSMSGWGVLPGFPKISVTNNSVTGANAITITPTETTQGQGGPVYSFCWTYKDILFMGGNPLQPFSIQPSWIFGSSVDINGNAIQDPYFGVNTGTGASGQANIFVVKSEQCTRVTGGYDMDNYCLITTDTDIFYLYGSNPDGTTGDFDLQRSKSKVGCIEQAAGVRIGPALYFYSGEDIYVFTGVDSVSITNGRIQAFLDSIPVSLRRAVNLGYNQERDVLLAHIPQYDSNNNLYFVTLTLHVATGAWGEIDGGINGNQVAQQQMACSLGQPSDGTQQNYVFFQFGDGILEWDPPYGTATTLNRNWSLQHAFNLNKSPNIQKDYMRYLLDIRWQTANSMVFLQDQSGQYLTDSNGYYLTTAPDGVPNPGITETFYGDQDPTTALQTIVGLVPNNGKIDVLLSGVTGDSISCSISGQLSTGERDGLFLSGYTAYFQAMEDL